MIICSVAFSLLNMSSLRARAVPPCGYIPTPDSLEKAHNGGYELVGDAVVVYTD